MDGTEAIEYSRSTNGKWPRKKTISRSRDRMNFQSSSKFRLFSCSQHNQCDDVIERFSCANFSSLPPLKRHHTLSFIQTMISTRSRDANFFLCTEEINTSSQHSQKPTNEIPMNEKKNPLAKLLTSCVWLDDFIFDIHYR